jgi:hypothetical protein
LTTAPFGRRHDPSDSYHKKTERHCAFGWCFHTQQKENAMSNLSRRTLVASAAALPALAVPAVAFSPDHPDAELLRLAPELEVIAEEYRIAGDISEKISREWDAACDRAGLLREPSWPDVKDTMSEKEFWDRYYAINAARGAIPHGDADLADEDGVTIWDKLGDRLDPLAEKILSIRAKTADGLRVQARAAALAAPDLWAVGEREQDFLEAVFAFLRVDQMGTPAAA